MFSRRLLLFTILGALVHGGCRLTGEDAPKPDYGPNRIGVEARCLSSVLPSMKAFMNGTATAEEIDGAWSCFAGALDLFAHKVRGKTSSHYEAREVARFFEEYFLPTGLRISDSLLEEIMHLKQLFVGGAADKISREELRKLTVFAGNMRRLSADLLPHMRILSGEWKGSGRMEEDLARFEKAERAGRAAFEQLASWIKPQGVSYRIESLLALFRELEMLYGEKWEITRTLEKHLPVLEELKGSLMGGVPGEIAAEEWDRLGRFLASAYGQYLRFEYFLRSNLYRDQDPNHRLEFLSLKEAFKSIQEFLGEKPGGFVTAAEMLAVLRRAEPLFTDVHFSPELVKELMKVKAVFLGGGVDTLRATEAGKAIVKLAVLEKVTSLLMGHWDVLTFKWSAATEPRDQALIRFEGAEKAISEMATELSLFFETAYNMADLKPLTRALHESFPKSESLGSLQRTVKKYLPLMETAKNLLLHDRSSLIAKEDWEVLVGGLSDLYQRAIFYSSFLRGRTILWGLGLEDFSRWSEASLGSVEKIFIRRGRGQPVGVEIEEMTRLADRLGELEMLPGWLSPAVVSKLLPVVIGRLLVDPEDRLNGRTPRVFDSDSVEVFALEWGRFLEVQRKLDGLVKARNFWSHKDLQKSLNGETAAEKEMLRILGGAASFAFDSLGQLYLATQKEIPYDRDSLLRVNVVRAVIRLAIRSYASSSKIITDLRGLTRHEAVDELFSEVRPALEEAGFLDPSNNNFARNRFFEASVFTPFSDGDEFVDFSEASALGLLIWSGVNLNNQLFPAIEKNCAVPNTKPVRYRVSCAMEALHAALPSTATSMPATVDLFSSLSITEGSELLALLLKAAGWEPDADQTALASDIGLLPHLIQYIESLYRRFDLDGSGVINKDEALAAEPVFRPVLSSVSGLNDPQILRAAFIYLLIFEKEPDDFFEFAEWAEDESQWIVDGTRPKIARILGYIADRIRAATTAPLADVQWPRKRL